MRILTLAKQVPASRQVETDPETGVLLRSQRGNKTNPYDLIALETGLRLRALTGGTLTVMTMGPPAARKVLYEAFAMGADAGVLLTDRRLAGSDVLATSFALSQAVAALPAFDIILCGKQTTDGDTAQVPPALAQWLKWPVAAWVKTVEPADGGRLRITQDLGGVVYTLVLSTPCVISVDADTLTPRLPSYKLYKATKTRAITTLTVDDFAVRDENRYGLDGSPTRVEKIFTPTAGAHNEILTGDAEDLADKLIALFTETKII